MGIFAVPKILLFLVGESQCFRVFDIQTFGKISCNQSIVVGGVDKYFRCQQFIGFGCRISVVIQLIDYQSIVFGIGDDRNEFVVFSSGPDHSGPADIYIFNDFCMGYPFFQNGLFKQLDGLDYDNNYSYTRYNYRANLDENLPRTTT